MSKYFCLKNVSLKRRAEQTGATQVHHKRGSRAAGGHKGRKAMFVTFQKKYPFYAI